MPPVCSNCGASDFLWANDLKTGTMGRGGLSLRRGGELSLGTRICRSCGHADLFVKDPAVLRQPHTWKPGEFVPITPSPGPAPPTPPTPVPHRPSSSPPMDPTPPAAAATPSEPITPAPESAGTPSANPASEPAAAESPSAAEDPAPKKSARKRSSKGKAPDSPPPS